MSASQSPPTPPDAPLPGLLPVFPLGTVLFPKGVLSLKVFEARYVDMVRGCLRNDTPFVVCRITHGGEVGTAAEHEPIGCVARIVDCDMEQAGLLLVRAIGGSRVKTRDRRVEKDGLVRAHVEPILDEHDVLLPDRFNDCRELLRGLIEDIAQRSAASKPKPMPMPVAEPYEFESSSWIGCRLCELLPLPATARQKLMELDDPLARLTVLQQFLRQRKIL